MSLSFTFDSDEFQFGAITCAAAAANPALAGEVHARAAEAPVSEASAVPSPAIMKPPRILPPESELEWSMERLERLARATRGANLRERRRLQLEAFNEVMRKCLEDRLGIASFETGVGL